MNTLKIHLQLFVCLFQINFAYSFLFYYILSPTIFFILLFVLTLHFHIPHFLMSYLTFTAFYLFSFSSLSCELSSLFSMLSVNIYHLQLLIFFLLFLVFFSKFIFHLTLKLVIIHLIICQPYHYLYHNLNLHY